MRGFKFLRKALCAFLALSIILCAFVACGGTGAPLLSIGETSLSVNVYEFYLSRMKGMLCTTAYFGESAITPEFWDTWYSVEDKKDYNDFYSEIILEDAKTYLAILEEFNKLGLELPQEVLDAIDADLQEMIDNDANGSKNAFNKLLSEYGANYDVLREVYIIEKKIEYFSKHLFGENGSKIGVDIIDKYFKDNYLRFRQIFLCSYEYVYEVDENGDEIYFRNDNSKISYDTTKTAMTKEDGSYVTDENGDRVFVYTDEEGKERIAYKKDGASIKHKLDADGNPLIRNFTDSEMKILNSDADAILAEAKEGDSAGFDVLVNEYNQDDTNERYPNGHYFSKNGNYDVMNVFEEVMSMGVGEIRKIPSEYGIHIVMRYELQDQAYMLEGNEEFFWDSDAKTYSFMSDLIDQLTYDYVKDTRKKVVVDEELLATVDIKRAGVNFYY